MNDPFAIPHCAPVRIAGNENVVGVHPCDDGNRVEVKRDAEFYSRMMFVRGRFKKKEPIEIIPLESFPLMTLPEIGFNLEVSGTGPSTAFGGNTTNTVSSSDSRENLPSVSDGRFY